jgi:phosphate transport system permease protein
LAVLLALTGLAGMPRGAAADSPPTLMFDPVTQVVAPGQEFTVNVIQGSAVPLTGAQTSVQFDPKLVQVKDFELGPAYATANAVFQFGNADLGTNASKDLVIAQANKSRLLENVAGFLMPGSGTIPAGDMVFLTVTFVAQPGAGGSVSLYLIGSKMIGETGDSITPQKNFSTVVVSPGGAPGASAAVSPGASGAVSPGASEAPTDKPVAPVSPTTPVEVSIAPTNLTLLAGNTARVFLVANSDGDISSVAADLNFDKDTIEITGIEAGPAWGAAVLIASVAGGTGGGVTAAIAEANTTGDLRQVGVFLPPGAQNLPYGEGVFVSVLVKAKVDATSSLSVGNAFVVGVSGEKITVTIDAGSLTKASDTGPQLDPTLVIPLVVLALFVAGALAVLRSGRIPVRVRRRWPFYVSLLLGLIPVVLFVGVVLTLLVNAAPVLEDPGIGALFGGSFLDARGLVVTGYDVRPALWGTALITVIAAAVALPTALILAVVAVDFPMGPIGRLVRPMVGVLSGVPAIVYAVSVPIFITAFMIPKFAANMNFSQFQNGGPAAIGFNVNLATWPPSDVPYSPGGFPWDLTGVANSTLLGGVLVGLFLIPFVTPLFVDALRDVPRAAREASFALGANRTYTLRRVVLPRALPAMAGASTLAVLKATGDALIVGFAVGWAAGSIPTPPMDVLERTTSIAAWGASILGSFEVLDATCQPAQCAVGYSSALALLLFAGLVVLVMTYLQARGRRRVAV